MALNRIKIAKDKANLVKMLVASNDTTISSFQTYADLIVFAAALGAKRKKRVSLKEVSKSDPDPIPQEHFISKGYELIIKLLAIAEYHDKKILDNSEEYDNQRINIFEEYANGGLEILQEELRGSVDHIERILLFLSSEKDSYSEVEFDLSKFI